MGQRARPVRSVAQRRGPGARSDPENDQVTAAMQDRPAALVETSCSCSDERYTPGGVEFNRLPRHGLLSLSNDDLRRLPCDRPAGRCRPRRHRDAPRGARPAPGLRAHVGRVPRCHEHRRGEGGHRPRLRHWCRSAAHRRPVSPSPGTSRASTAARISSPRPRDLRAMKALPSKSTSGSAIRRASISTTASAMASSPTRWSATSRVPLEAPGSPKRAASPSTAPGSRRG